MRAAVPQGTAARCPRAFDRFVGFLGGSGLSSKEAMPLGVMGHQGWRVHFRRTTGNAFPIHNVEGTISVLSVSLEKAGFVRHRWNDTSRSSRGTRSCRKISIALIDVLADVKLVANSSPKPGYFRSLLRMQIAKSKEAKGFWGLYHKIDTVEVWDLEVHVPRRAAIFCNPFCDPFTGLALPSMYFGAIRRPACC